MTIRTSLGDLVTRHRWRAASGGMVVLAAIVVVVVGVWWWNGSSPPSQPVPPPAARSPTSPEAAIPFVQVEGSRLTGVDPAGQKLWEFQAKSVQMDREKTMVTFTEIVGQLYQRGVPQFAFQAPRGILFLASRNVELTGGVSGRTADGRRMLRAPQVRWDAARQRLTGSGGIHLIEPGMSVTAETVVTDVALQQTTFVGNIKVQVTR